MNFRSLTTKNQSKWNERHSPFTCPASAIPTAPQLRGQPTSLSVPLALRSLTLSESIAIRNSARPHTIACAVLAVTEIVKRRATDGLMGARGAVLPIAKRGSPDPIGRATQARSGARIEIGLPHTVARRARSIVEIIEVCLANGLSRAAELIKIVESRVADVGAGAGLGLSQWGKTHRQA